MLKIYMLKYSCLKTETNKKNVRENWYFYLHQVTMEVYAVFEYFHDL